MSRLGRLGRTTQDGNTPRKRRRCTFWYPSMICFVPSGAPPSRAGPARPTPVQCEARGEAPRRGLARPRRVGSARMADSAALELAEAAREAHTPGGGDFPNFDGLQLADAPPMDDTDAFLATLDLDGARAAASRCAPPRLREFGYWGCQPP